MRRLARGPQMRTLCVVVLALLALGLGLHLLPFHHGAMAVAGLCVIVLAAHVILGPPRRRFGAPRRAVLIPARVPVARPGPSAGGRHPPEEGKQLIC